MWTAVARTQTEVFASVNKTAQKASEGRQKFPRGHSRRDDGGEQREGNSNPSPNRRIHHSSHHSHRNRPTPQASPEPLIPPATASPNFHLFFKAHYTLSLQIPFHYSLPISRTFFSPLFFVEAVAFYHQFDKQRHLLAHCLFQGGRLRSQTQIGSYPIQRGEFLVLVPFTKKEPTRTREPDPVQPSANVPHSASSSTSNLADSTWSTIMEDLSILRDTTEGCDNASNSESKKEEVLEAQTKGGLGSEKQIELPYHLILNTLRDSSEGALGEHNCEVFAKVLESVNCLSDLPLGRCKLFKRACSKGGGGGLRKCGSDGATCLCPPWLKIVVKAFAFVNIFSAFLYLQRRELTSILLEEALSELAKFGVKLGLDDIKHLSLLCPQVH
ncbi:putative ATP-dependent helicase HRQ1 [Spatholobus suberectus]|nr:putative ATP-dependent helicase HRQ1 [Spatholobus suberectus]